VWAGEETNGEEGRSRATSAAVALILLERRSGAAVDDAWLEAAELARERELEGREVGSDAGEMEGEGEGGVYG
jgi:hypothetical protein